MIAHVKALATSPLSGPCTHQNDPASAGPMSCGLTERTDQPRRAAMQLLRLVTATAPSTAVDSYDLISDIRKPSPHESTRSATRFTPTFQAQDHKVNSLVRAGAGDGNRTRVASLEGRRQASLRPLPAPTASIGVASHDCRHRVALHSVSRLVSRAATTCAVTCPTA